MRTPSLLCLGLLLSILPLWGDYARVENVAYYPAPQDAYQAEQCRLDLYYPTNTKAFATVVWFHGGGLVQGKRSVPRGLMERGVAVVAVSYRLSPKVNAPAYIEDAAQAVAWTMENIASYGGSAAKVFVSGHSAGGYLAAMVGLDARWLAPYGLKSDDLAGIVPFSGQMITHFTIRAERDIPGSKVVVDDLAPMTYVRRDTPPVLLITGDRNLEIMSRYEENAFMWRLLKTAGNTRVELMELDGYGHVDMPQGAFPLLLKFIRRIEQAQEAPAAPAAG